MVPGHKQLRWGSGKWHLNRWLLQFRAVSAILTSGRQAGGWLFSDGRAHLCLRNPGRLAGGEKSQLHPHTYPIPSRTNQGSNFFQDLIPAKISPLTLSQLKATHRLGCRFLLVHRQGPRVGGHGHGHRLGRRCWRTRRFVRRDQQSRAAAAPGRGKSFAPELGTGSGAPQWRQSPRRPAGLKPPPLHCS